MRNHAFAERRRYADPLFPVSCWSGDELHFVAHWHPEVELLFVSSGHIRMGINQHRLQLGPGDLAIVGSNDIHYYEESDAACRYSMVIFSPELIGLPAGWPHRGWAGQPVVRGAAGMAAPDWAEIPILMTRIIQEMERKAKSWPAMVRSALWETTARIERLSPTRAGPDRDPGGTLTLDRMQSAIDWIHRNFRRPVSLADAAKAATMSPYHFSRLFSRYTGQNLSSYVNHVRVERALELLAGSGSIMEIALACGFASLRSFNRAFKAHAACTPREARRRAAAPPGDGLTPP